MMRLPRLLMLRCGLIFTTEPAPMVRLEPAEIVISPVMFIRESSAQITAPDNCPEIGVQVVVGSILISLNAASGPTCGLYVRLAPAEKGGRKPEPWPRKMRNEGKPAAVKTPFARRSRPVGSCTRATMGSSKPLG